MMFDNKPRTNIFLKSSHEFPILILIIPISDEHIDALPTLNYFPSFSFTAICTKDCTAYEATPGAALVAVFLCVFFPGQKDSSTRTHWQGRSLMESWYGNASKKTQNSTKTTGSTCRGFLSLTFIHRYNAFVVRMRKKGSLDNSTSYWLAGKHIRLWLCIKIN